MLMLLFFVGDERFACVCDAIVEIIPLVSLRKLGQGQDFVAGLLNYAGKPVPVIDFTQLCVQRPSAPYLSTRIIIFRRQREGMPEETLGLIAERVTDTVDREPSDFVDSGFNLRRASFIGGVVNDSHGIIYQLLVDELFNMVHRVLTTT